MQVQEAVARAKELIKEVFSSENIRNLGLEEVEFDDRENLWSITVGFSRPWDAPANALAKLRPEDPQVGRSYKVVRISDATGEMISIRSRNGSE